MNFLGQLVTEQRAFFAGVSAGNRPEVTKLFCSAGNPDEGNLIRRACRYGVVVAFV